MSTPYCPSQGCPKCGGQTGYEFTMTEEHTMGGGWGEPPTSGDSGRNARDSLVTCLDCRHRFQPRKLAAIGAMG